MYYIVSYIRQYDALNNITHCLLYSAQYTVHDAQLLIIIFATSKAKIKNNNYYLLPIHYYLKNKYSCKEVKAFGYTIKKGPFRRLCAALY